ncbi:MAG: NUDIX domain-containing protein [Prevotella sp.]|nr:NUDIX domain-containing protein [Prevotella sp.]
MSHPLEVFSYCPRCGSSQWAVNNVKSKHCAACGFTYYANPSSATAAFILRRGADGQRELLIVRRAKEPSKGTLDLPGGFVDMDETAEEGMLREIREETGLTMTACRYLFSLPNLYTYSGMDIHTLDMFYLCEAGEEAQPQAADDAEACQWVNLQDLRPEDFGLRSIRNAVRRFIENC